MHQPLYIPASHSERFEKAQQMSAMGQKRTRVYLEIGFRRYHEWQDRRRTKQSMPEVAQAGKTMALSAAAITS